MRLIGKLIIIFILLGMLLGASAYVIFYTGENDNGQDTEPPQITAITGNITVTAGHVATITVQFVDNVNVTVATLYYKTADAASWSSESILNGSATLLIPSYATSNYDYYITVDDAAGNGPVGNPSIDGTSFYVITVLPSGGNPDNETLTHTVFFEEATAGWCTNCPNVAKILSSLYDSDKYNFYYIALINGTSPDTTQRLWNDYNIWGFPTVFVDGGYQVITGATNPDSTYINAINAARQRTIPKIKVTVTAQYQNITQVVTVNTLIENRDNGTYNGRLKLYLTEILSHFNDYNNEQYHFGFLEYLTDKDISVNGKGNITLTETKNLSGYDYENLMIIGVVFNSEKHQGYANPKDITANLFDAYYADATNATKVVPKGNLPPQLQVTSPLKGNVYWNGKPVALVDTIIQRKHLVKKIGKISLENFSILHEFLYNKTYLLGKNKIITVNATDDSAVAKVEFYIDDTLQYNATKPPYEYTFSKISNHRSLFIQTHTLKVIVYDDTGKTASASFQFKARI
jgi:hypothetical protein